MSTSIVQSRLCLVFNDKAYLLSSSVRSSFQASKSFVLSMAEFMCYVGKFYPESIISQELKAQKNFLNSAKRLKEPVNYLQIWNDFIFSLVKENKIMQINDQAIFFAHVSQQYLEYALKSNLFFEVKNPNKEVDIKKNIASSVYNVNWEPTAENEIRKIYIINLSKSVTNVDKTQPKINVDGLFSGAYYQSGDRWTSYKILKGQIPTVEDLIQADTILISGSTYSVNNMPEFIKKFQINLKAALAQSKTLKVAGFCFGHQLVAKTFGAKIVKKDLVRGPQNIVAKPHNLGQINYLSELSNGQEYNVKIYEYHSDFVVDVPQGFACIGTSKSCENEIFVSEDKRIFTFQFHPEYLVEYIKAIEKRWINDGSLFSGIHQDDYKEDAYHHKTCQLFRKVIRNFIDWEVTEN